MPTISVGLNVTLSWVPLVTFSVALSLMNFSFIVSVICSFTSHNFVMAIPDIFSINRASTMISFYSLGFTCTFSLGKKGMDLFKKLIQESCESITPSNSKMFLIPKTKSTFSWISDTKVNTPNLCSCMVKITGITNNIPIY